MSTKSWYLGLVLIAAIAMGARAEVDCGDGLDNDGDVAIDMEDAGCYAAGTVYYVSSAQGNDAWNGLSPVPAGGSNGPKQTLAGVASLANNLTAGQKLLFRRGETWVAGPGSGGVLGIFNVRGAQASPAVIGAYGAGARPVLLCDEPGAFSLVVAGVTEWLIVRDLRLTTGIPHDSNPPTGASLGGGAHDVTFSNLLIEELQAGLDNWTDGFIFENSIMRFNHRGNAPSGGANGIFSQGARVVIRGNEFERNGQYVSPQAHQVYIGSSDDVLIENNRFHNSNDGVKVAGSNNVTVRNNEFWDLAVQAMTAGGNNLLTSRGIVISGNYFHDVNNGVVLKNQNSVNFGLSDVDISNNVFGRVNGSPYGQALTLNPSPLENIAVHHNVFYQSAGYVDVLLINNSAPVNMRIANNIFYRADAGVPNPGDVPTIVQVYFNPTLQGVTLANNIYQAASAGIAVVNFSGGPRYNTLAAFRAAFPGQEVGGAEGDPMWADPANGDFHLTPASALAIDRGAVEAGVTVDRDGDPRPLGAGYDIGVDEYAGGPVDAVAPARPQGLRVR